MPTIDLRSDTVTKPSAAMREAMAHADVGDDVYGEDPTVRRLEAQAAELTGKEAALFVPSGTMANQIAIRCHTRPGDAMIAGRNAHVYLYEGGGAAAVSGVQTVLVGESGLFDADDVRGALYPRDPHFARSRLVAIENTHNRSGGRVLPFDAQQRIAEVARAAGLALHLDGARIWNAALACGRSVFDLCAPFDSVSFCLSKGLGAPVGSLLCGRADLIADAHRVRKMLGGGMRQVGILAAAGLYALDHHTDQLSEDHANARLLAKGLASAPRVSGVAEPDTNIVLFDVGNAADFARAAKERGVLLSAVSRETIRAVTHLDVTRDDIEVVIETVIDLDWRR